MTITLVTILIATFFFASFLHGITGLGVTLVTTAVLASMFPLEHAIVLTIFPSAILNAATWLFGGDKTVQENFTFYIKEYWLLALMSLVGSLIGVKLLLVVDNSCILILLSLVIAFYVSLQLLGKKIILPNNSFALVTTGIIAGIVGGSTNAMSTILIMYILSISNDKNTLVKVGNMCYLLGKIAQIIMLRNHLGELSIVDWYLILGLSTVSILGLFGGIRLRHHLTPEVFRYIVLIILVVLGFKVGYQGIIGLPTL